MLGTCIEASMTLTRVSSLERTVKEEKGDLITNSHSILVRWKNHFSQLLNIPGVDDVRQREIHTAELLFPELSAFEFELVTVKLKVTYHQVFFKSLQN
jgi:hypothetical protein